ncbi:MAG: hypothetical protein BWY41_00111 [Candidatus Atribacteria bacterium ADurb.Bin276]|uniref:Uncharacterized protein n=1 Tax=Candidatus Atribacter allofermentans TaxID=1852833 RepID=A0A1V5T4U4_9BACT|nr:MAG: hypothetical protein BWY41_00111 [Candidatus Atribacteria bacterium ADurb.Bin276]
MPPQDIERSVMKKMMNVTLETYKTQCDSYPFIFPKMGTYKEVKDEVTGEIVEKIPLNIVEVPDRLAPLLYEQMKSKGVFIIPDNPEEFEEAKRQAMINYLNGRLKTRISNHLMQKDEYERKGSTFQFTETFNEALRWDKEIRHVLNQQKPMRESGSFLDHFNAEPLPEIREVKDETKASEFEDFAKSKYPPRRMRSVKSASELEGANV